MTKNYGRELWESLCELVSPDDGLPTFESGGYWTADKLYFVCQYLEQTTRGMKKRTRWPSGLTYIDLFSGTGVSVVRDSDGRTTRFPGSPLIAASTPEPFDRLILVERDDNAMKSLLSRLERTEYSGEVVPFCEDSNVIVDEIALAIPTDSLNVAFIDPYSLDAHFSTIRQLASKRALDLIILFSDRFDLGRNVHKYYYPSEESSKLDLFLGRRDWRTRLDEMNNQTGQGVRALFAEIYSEQLGTLGYDYRNHWPLEGPNGPVFRLFFASKHELGLKFCEIARQEGRVGERGLFG